MAALLKVVLSIGFPTAVRKDTLELEDDATPEEMEEAVQQWANEYISISWDRID